MKYLKPSVFAFTAFLFLCSCVFMFLCLPSHAGGNDNISGWAWSDNIGYISHNCIDTEEATTCDSADYDYGVNIDENGDFSGYAWSESVGWINYAPTETSPDGVVSPAKYNTVTGEVSGWARILVFEDGGGGWIKMRGIADDGTPYGVSIDEQGYLSGFAYSDDIGWIEYGLKDYDYEDDGVRFGVAAGEERLRPKPPTAEITFIPSPVYMTEVITFTLTASDEDGTVNSYTWNGEHCNFTGNFAPPLPDSDTSAECTNTFNEEGRKISTYFVTDDDENKSSIKYLSVDVKSPLEITKTVSKTNVENYEDMDFTITAENKRDSAITVSSIEDLPTNLTNIREASITIEGETEESVLEQVGNIYKWTKEGGGNYLVGAKETLTLTFKATARSETLPAQWSNKATVKFNYNGTDLESSKTITGQIGGKTMPEWKKVIPR